MAKPKDITNVRSGKLVALERGYKFGDTYKWKCRCDCGNITYVTVSNILHGNTLSCGCLKVNPPLNIKHGESIHGQREKLYQVWVAMKQRCTNPNDRNYARYGGRGIKVCNEWKSSYEVFKRWCIENGYVEGLDIDRIDNDAGYGPDNCRFVTHQRNLLNTHRRLHAVIGGEDISLRDAADKYGITYKCIYHRYRRGKRGDDLVRS